MNIPPGFQSGYPAREQERWCVRREGASRTLCGRLVRVRNAEGYFPIEAFAPTDEKTGCTKCKELLKKIAAEGDG